jgi:hypothetical protein
MDYDAAHPIAQRLVDSLNLDATFKALESATYDVAQALEALPPPTQFQVQSPTGTEAIAFLLAPPELFEVRAAVGLEGGDASATTTMINYRLSDPEWTVRLESTPAAVTGGFGRQTKWEFLLGGNIIVAVLGEAMIRPEPGEDEAEEFARALADELGWRLVPAPDSE